MPVRTKTALIRRSFVGSLLFAVAVPVIILSSDPVSVMAQSSGSARPQLVLQTGHTGPINAIALSPDGRFLVSGSDDSTLKLWDIAAGNVLRTLFGHDKPVLGIAISADSRLIASGSEDGSVRIWDVATGQARTLGAHSSSVKDLAFSADARQLTSLGSAELKLWDVASGREIRSTDLVKEKNSIQAAMARYDQSATAITLDGRFGAVGGGTSYKNGVFGFGGGVKAKPIRIIETATGREIQALKLTGDIPNPTDLSFSPDGRLLVAKFVELGARNRAAQSSLVVFEVATGRELKTFPSGDAYGIGGIAFSPDGKTLASRISVQSGDVPTDPKAMGQYISGSIKLIEVDTWREVRELKKTGAELDLARGLASTPLCFSSDGKMLAASLGEGVVLFDAATGGRVVALRTRERATAISASPSAQASQDEMMRQAGIDPEELRQIQESVGSILGTASPFGSLGPGLPISTASTINFSPDGKLLTSTNTLTVWDVAAGTPHERERAAGVATGALSLGNSGIFSPDGKLTASVGAQGSAYAVIVKDAASGRVVRSIVIGTPASGPRPTGPIAQISSIAFSTRGVLVQFCEFTISRRGPAGFGGGMSQECHIKTFDPTSGKELRDLKLESDRSSFSGMGMGGFSTLSPDGRFQVSLVMESSGSGVGMFRPSLPGLGRRGGGGGEPPKQSYKIRLTDIDSGRRLWETKVESENMTSAPSFVFSPNGGVLAITSRDKDQPVINFYETNSGRKISSLNSGSRKIGAMNFSADGKMLALTYSSGSQAPVTFNRSSTRSQTPGGGDNLVTVYELSTGKQLFVLTHETAVTGVTFSPAGKLIATAGQDRNQYLWDAQTGEKLATLVNLDIINLGVAGSEWLVITPDGLFDGSPAAWQQIMWRFSENTFDTGPVELFFNELYYPGLAGEIFSGRRPKAPRDLQQIDRRQPKVRVTLNPPAAGEITSRTLAIRIEVEEAAADATHRQGSGARDVRLFRNGTLVKLWRGDVLKGESHTVLDATLSVVAGENRITAYAFNQDNVKSPDAFLAVTGAALLRRKGIAYVLAFGVNQYENAQYNLKFAGADASDFADEVRAQQTKLARFERIEVVELLDKEATKLNLLSALKRLAGNATVPEGAPAALAKLEQAQPEDAVMIYFAGHGTAKGPRFYLVPHDLGYAGARSGIDAQAVETILGHSISDLELESAVEGLDAGEILLVIDACNSGQALEAEEKRRGPMNSKGLAQLAYEKGMYILTAAQSYQAALEASQLGHGYLTYTLVEEGLKKGMADREQPDGQVSVREWFDYATDRVPEMQELVSGSRLLLEEDSKAKDPNHLRNLQRPRAFYRREVELQPVIIGKP